MVKTVFMIINLSMEITYVQISKELRITALIYLYIYPILPNRVK